MNNEIYKKLKLEIQIIKNYLINLRKEVIISDVPYMNKESADRLAIEYKKSSCILEYGSGASTLMALKCSVDMLFTVESDKNFMMTLVNNAKRLRNDSKTKFFPLYQNIGPVGAWGRPMRMNHKTTSRFPNYATDVWDVIRKEGVIPDFVLIDGRFRVACAVTTIIECKTLSPDKLPTLWIDDFTGRKNHYGVIEDLLDNPEIIGGRAIAGKPRMNLELMKLKKLFEEYCKNPE